DRPPSPAASAEAGGRATRILVVDDEPMLREALRDVLSHLGFGVLEAEDGPQSLALLGTQAEEVGLVILDMTMPGMQGTEVLAGIRALPGSVATVPVILVSGYTQEDLSGALSQQAPTCFLRKPFSMRELSRKISECLGGSSESGD
ncbi:MAG TPA: response regulator, partial [Holophagaceae bacterium]